MASGHGRIVRSACQNPRMRCRRTRAASRCGSLTAGPRVLLARAELAAARAFETDARIAHRLLSQRAVQHDAVLATLALLQPPAGAGAGAALPALYPQILSVQRRDRRRPGRAGAGRRGVRSRVDAARRWRRRLRARPLPPGAGGRAGQLRARFDLRAWCPGTNGHAPADHPGAAQRLNTTASSSLLQPGSGRAGSGRLSFQQAPRRDSQPFDLVARRAVGWSDCPGAGSRCGPRHGGAVPHGTGLRARAPNAAGPRNCCAWARSRGSTRWASWPPAWRTS
jgi:hypothetical protein